MGPVTFDYSSVVPGVVATDLKFTPVSGILS